MRISQLKQGMRLRAGGLISIATLGALILVACVGSPTAPEQLPPAPETAQLSLAHVMQRYIDDVDALNIATAQTLLSTSARASVDPANPDSEPMTFFDESNTELVAGGYNLVTYCAGDGSFDARFTIGDTTTEQRLHCGLDPQVGDLPLQLLADAQTMSVELDATEGTQAAIAYRVQLK